jgi:DMATS type aromatic prenyltransferase
MAPCEIAAARGAIAGEKSTKPTVGVAMNGELKARGEAAGASYFEHGAERLTALCRANGLDDRVAEVIDTFGWLIASWGRRPIAAGTGAWTSDVADDHTPYEFSVVYGGPRPEVRILVEALGDPPGRDANWHAGLQLSEQIADRFGISLERHDRIADLFVPKDGARLGIWHAVSFWPDLPPEPKVYFDSQAQGRWRAPAVMEEALCRLGFSRAWPAVRRLSRRGLDLAEMRFLSLDLAGSADARVKVYCSHRDATAHELAELMREAGSDPDDVIEFCRAMTGSDGPYVNRPVFQCATLVDPASPDIYASTLYVPVVAYAPSDAAAVQRIERYLGDRDLDAARYRATIEACTSRRLDTTASLHSYVSLRRRSAHPQVTAYFSPEAHAIQPARPVATRAPVRTDPAPAQEIVRRYENDIVLEDHPYLRRLGREPVALGHLWLVLANFWEAIVSDFPARLAHVVSRIDDDAIRSIFVKQLNDELGEGDFSRAHKAMFRRLLEALAPYRLAGDDDTLLGPGRAFGAALKQHLFADDPYEAIGALMMIEIYGKQTDIRLGREFRRQNELPDDALTWLRLHETLEVDHADDSLRLANMLPMPGADVEADRRLAAVWRGAEGVVHAGMAYFDALYAVSFR